MNNFFLFDTYITLKITYLTIIGEDGCLYEYENKNKDIVLFISNILQK